jgi:uncharacterized membrane protein YqgA involved in biofilm formation
MDRISLEKFPRLANADTAPAVFAEQAQLLGVKVASLEALFVQKQMFVYYRSINQIETAYYIMFAVCGGAYLLGWLIMHMLVPKMKRVEA